MKKLVGILLVVACLAGMVGKVAKANMKDITHILLIDLSEDDSYVNTASSTTTTPPVLQRTVIFTSFEDMDAYLKANNVSGTLVNVVENKQYEIAQTPVVVVEEVDTITGYTYNLTEK